MMGRVPNSALITPSLLTIVIIIAVGHDDDGDDDDDGNDDDYDDDDDGDALCTGWDGGLASPIMKTGLRAQQGAYPPILYTRSLFFGFLCNSSLFKTIQAESIPTHAIIYTPIINF